MGEVPKTVGSSYGCSLTTYCATASARSNELELGAGEPLPYPRPEPGAHLIRRHSCRAPAQNEHGIPSADPVSLAAVSAGLLGVTLAASYLPARRASRVDAIRALRAE
jgi:ABC-type antimicrobial peptide transport system permease subunit